MLAALIFVAACTLKQSQEIATCASRHHNMSQHFALALCSVRCFCGVAANNGLDAVHERG